MGANKLYRTLFSCLLLATLFAIILQLCIIRYESIRQKKREWQTREFVWMAHCQTLEVANEYVLRCKTRNMGCYKAPREAFTAMYEVNATLKDRESSAESYCMNHCYQRKFDFVELFDGRCYCIKSPDFGRLTASCEDPPVSRVKSVEDCKRGVSGISLLSSKLGCVEVPGNLSENTTAFRILNLTTKTCYLACETRGFVLASPLSHLDVCICSDLVSMFENVEGMVTKLRDCGEAKSTAAKYAPRMPVFHTGAFDELCDRREFSPLSVKSKVGLLSCPGSGNTWMRHLIEAATGYYTGSLHSDESLARGRDPFHRFVGDMWPVEAHPGVITIKAHKVNSQGGYVPKIALTRNPYHTKRSEFTRRSSHSHTGRVLESMYQDVVGIISETWPVVGHPGGMAINVRRLRRKMIYDSAIVLIRNPYHAKAAEFARKISQNHTGQIPESMYLDVGFAQEMQTSIWRDLPVSALRNIRPVLVVYYEDVLDNSVRELRRIVNFLLKELHLRGQQPERRLMCVILDPVGKFKRAPVELKYNPVNDEMTMFVERQIREVNETLLAFEQPPLPPSYLSHKWMHLSNY